MKAIATLKATLPQSSRQEYIDYVQQYCAVVAASADEAAAFRERHHAWLARAAPGLIEHFADLVITPPASVVDAASGGGAAWEAALAELLGAWAEHDSATFWWRVGPLLSQPAPRRVALAACGHAGGEEGIEWLARLIRDCESCSDDELLLLPAAIVQLPPTVRLTFLYDLQARVGTGPELPAAAVRHYIAQLEAGGEARCSVLPDTTMLTAQQRTLYALLPWLLALGGILVPNAPGFDYLLDSRHLRDMGLRWPVLMGIQAFVGMLAPVLVKVMRAGPHWACAARHFAWGSLWLWMVWVAFVGIFLALPG